MPSLIYADKAIFDFYTRSAPAEQWHKLYKYGVDRARDCFYAQHIADFEVLKLDKFYEYEWSFTELRNHPSKFDFLYNRKGHKRDLSWIIAPDTRVPNYTTNFWDAYELAAIMGFPIEPNRALSAMGKTELEIALIKDILSGCDHMLKSEGFEKIELSDAPPAPKVKTAAIDPGADMFNEEDEVDPLA